MKDKCVSCGSETAYDESTHIDMRDGYIEGLGQLCFSCYISTKERNHIIVPEAIIIMTPNNNELGSKIRELYYESKN